MKCMRVVERDPEGQVHKGCPNDAIEERLVQINNLPILLPMCAWHDAEFDQKAAEYRNRRRQREGRTAGHRG